MSILNVNQIQPVGGGNTITVSASDVNFSGNISIGSSFVGTASTATLAIISQGLTGIPDITVNNIQSGVVTATTFIGDGSGITGVTASGSGIGIKDSASTVGVAATVDFGTNLNVSPAFAGIVTVTVGDTDFEIVDKIVHTGDTDTAIRFPATDTISAETSGVERLRITSTGKLEAYKGTSTTGKTSGSEALTVGNGAGSHRFAVYPDGTTVIGGTGDIGNYNILLQNDGKAVFDSDVGIGTDNPAEILHLNGATTKSLLRFTSGSYGTASTDGSHIGINFGGLEVWHKENNYLRFGTNSVERLRITSNGDVGIGTAIPIAAANYTSLSLVNTTGAQIEFKKTSNNTTHYIYNDGTANLNIAANYSGTTVGDLVITVGGNTERLRITSAGYMGVNDTTPSYHLDVNGSIRSQATGSGTGLLLHSNCGLTANSNLMQIWSGQANGISFHTNATGDGSNERLRIQSSGGLTFNGDTAAANALDDYEEGYWTPTIYSGGNPSSTIAVRRARYTKVGRKVTICGEVLFTGGDGGMFRLAGLPYFLETTGTAPSGQSGAGMSAVGNILFSNLNITGVSCLTAYLWSNLIYFYYTPSGDGAVWSAMTGNQIGGNSGGGDLIFTVTYFTST